MTFLRIRCCVVGLASLAAAFTTNPPFVTRRPAQYTAHLSWEEGNDSSFQEDGIHDASLPVESPFLLEHTKWTASIQTAIQNVEKKRASLESELEKAETLEVTVARAQLITHNLHVFNSPSIQQATVHDWDNDGKQVELMLNSAYDSAVAEAAALFQQARKLKRGSAVVQSLLEETNSALSRLEIARDELAAVLLQDETVSQERFLLVQERLLRSPHTANLVSFRNDNVSQQQTRSGSKTFKKPELGTPASNVRKITSPHSGCTILVGRNRRGNEYLSFKEARQKDIWLHARGTPGAHVLILQRSPTLLATDDCWQLAANLAGFYSDG